MAYNLRSLAYSINQILHPVPQFDSVHKSEKEKLESLLEKVNTLQQILENLPLPTYNRLEMLQRQVIHMSHRAEDIVDSAIVNLVSVRHRGVPNSRKNKKAGKTFLQDLQRVIEEFDSLINKDLTVVDPTPESPSSVAGCPPRRASWLKRHFTSKAKGVAEPPARVASLGSWFKRHFTSKGVAEPLVSTRKLIEESQPCRGLDKDIQRLKDRLTRYEPALEVIPIVGMGGIGKTFLAQKLYDDPSIVEHYDCRAWVTISQEYEVESIISTLLSCITKNQEEKDETSLRLHKCLFNRRYLIVLDDIWSTTTWDKLCKFFPDNGRSSTIILTTRDQEMAAYANPSNVHSMKLLGPDDSWDLFRVKVFGEKEDHPELEKLGRKISENCKGLPLAISVISGLLLECDNTDLWEHVAYGISPTVALDEQFSKILSLSYDHLPHHLRPCFLYLGAFSKGAEIRVSRIKRLWAAESFLKPIEDKTPEEAAEQYLEDLKNRNLLVVHERKSCGKVKSYGMHDLLKDLCVTRSAQEDFVVCSEYGHAVEVDEFTERPIMKSLGRSIEGHSWRRVILNNKSFEKEVYNEFCIDYPEDSPARAYIFSQEYMVSELLSVAELVRVFDASEMHLLEFPEKIVELVNIRYLSISCKLLHGSLSSLWNLETLIFCPNRSGRFDIPDEIWELGKLKHFKIIGRTGVVGRVELHSALETLQTLSVVDGKTSVENLIKRIPNIEELGLDLRITGDIDLSSLHNLENLKIANFPQSSIGFPSSIAKLTLYAGYNMDENFMKVIGELPSLKVLKIQLCYWKYFGCEKEWKTYEAGFPSLHFLELGISNMKKWSTEDETHFPVLRHLLIRGCFYLEEIPSCMGDIPSLEIIEIDRCCKSVVTSARRIWKEQHDMSNDGLQVRIRDYGYGTNGKWEYL